MRSEEYDVVTANAAVEEGSNNVQLKLTGINDGSTTLSAFVNAYRIGLGVTIQQDMQERNQHWPRWKSTQMLTVHQSQ